jgi:hypothetical protein
MSVVVLKPGVEITSGLVTHNSLEFKGDSGMAASIGNHIDLVRDVRLQFIADRGKASRGIWLCDVGTEYGVLPSIVSMAIAQRTDEEPPPPLAARRKRTNCEEWLTKVSGLLAGDIAKCAHRF